jgi:hypothetical protein
MVRFHESLPITGVRLSSATQLVLQLWCAKPALAGLPSRDSMVAWAVTPVLHACQVSRGVWGRGGGGEGLRLVHAEPLLSCLQHCQWQTPSLPREPTLSV